MASDLSGLSADVARLFTPLIEKAVAEARRETTDLVMTLLTVEIGQALERVRDALMSPTKSALIFDEPLDENASIAELRLTSSLQHLLRSEGHFETIKQLRDSGDWDIRVRGIGKATLAKIDAHLAAAGHPRPYRGQNHAPTGEETPDTA